MGLITYIIANSLPLSIEWVPNIMRPDYYIQRGFIVKKFDRNGDSHEKNGNLFSLTRWFKKMLQRFNVSYLDDCCPPTEEDLENLPVRYNTTEDRLERYDPETDAWVAVS